MDIDHFSKEECGELIYKLLVDLGLQNIDIKKHRMAVENASFKSLDDGFQQYINKKDYPEKVKTLALQSAERIRFFSPYTSDDHRAHLTLLITLAMCIEDGEDDMELLHALNNFEHRLLSGEPQDHPLLTEFVDILKNNRKYYGPYGCMMITKGAIEGFASLVVEHKFEQEKIKVPRGAFQFPAYFRYKTCVIDSITHLNFPEAMFPEAQYLHIYLPVIAELGPYLAYFNDIISFYKETLVGDEEFNYICNLSNAKGITVKEAFKSVCEDAVNNFQNIEKILVEQPELLVLVKTVMKNRFVFYAIAPRYRLSEIPVLREMLQ